MARGKGAISASRNENRFIVRVPIERDGDDLTPRITEETKSPLGQDWHALCP